MFSGLPCETHIAQQGPGGEWMFSGLPCETHIAHIAHIARTRGTGGLALRTRRILHGFCMVFAWFLHDMWNSLLFCTVLHAVLHGMTCGTACFFA